MFGREARHYSLCVKGDWADSPDRAPVVRDRGRSPERELERHTMKVWMLGRCLLASSVRNPWTWALWIALASFWPAVQAMAPLGTDPGSAAARGTLYELAFMASGLGVAATLGFLELLPRCSYALGLRPGWPSEGVLLALGGIATSIAALALPVTIESAHDASLVPAIAMRVLLTAAALASIGLVVLRVPWLAGSQAAAMLVIAWIVPALLGSSFAADFLGRGPRWTSDLSIDPAALASRIVSICALLLSVHLVDAHRERA